MKSEQTPLRGTKQTKDEVVREGVSQASHAEEPKKKRNPFGKILFFVLLVILLGAVAYIANLQIISPSMSKRASAKKNLPQAVEVYHFQRLTTNPAGTAGRRFIVVSLTAEFDLSKKKELLKELESKNAQIQHRLIGILSNKTIEDLETDKESLRKEILLKLNETLVTGKLKEIYFTEFVIQ